MLTPTEQSEFDEAQSAENKNDQISDIEIFTSLMESIEPWGVGMSLGISPQNMAANLAVYARYIRSLSDSHRFNSSNSGRKATYVRQNEDRVQQSNSAAFEVKNINAQIAVQQTHIAAANQEIANQQKMIDNSIAVVDFLKSPTTSCTPGSRTRSVRSSTRPTTRPTTSQRRPRPPSSSSAARSRRRSSSSATTTRGTTACKTASSCCWH